jgi:valine--pyruvate aminotransferase
MINLQFSQFSQKFLGECGILQLMDDLGKALKEPGMIMLGGGNPSQIPEIQQAFRDRMLCMLDSDSEFEDLIGNYSSPNGEQAFVAALADFFREECGWDVSPKNIVLTNGSQTAFFFLFNLFAGIFPDNTHKKILLPLAPEYIGYENAGISPNIFRSFKPHIQHFPDHIFKYRVDFDALEVGDDIGAICVSRPTNPTGNVLTEDEISQLSDLAKAHNIPLIVDNAYGAPFPNIIYTDAKPQWEEHVVMCLSLSKLGLPGARTGIVVAHESIIHAITSMNAVISLAPGNLGATMALDAVRTRDILRLSHDIIKPHYEDKAKLAVNWLREAMGDDVPYRIHKPEGAFFLWLWFPNLPINSQELYERLKARGLIIVPGHYFFPGLDEAWGHTQECIRLSYSQDADKVLAGIQILAEEVKRAWEEVA